MKNKRWLRLTGWLLTLVMILTVYPIATLAESETTELPSENLLHPVTELAERPAEVDISELAKITYEDEGGKSIKVASMNPNKVNSLKLKVSGLNEIDEIDDSTQMTVTVPENVKITNKGLQSFNNEAVDATVNEGKLILSWKSEKQDSLEATFDILPNIPANNDLSGSYVLGTARKSMLGTSTFKDNEKNRDKLFASEFTETGSGIRPGTDENPVWVLEHVTGDYYTVRAQNTSKYIYISPVAKNNYLASSLYLVAGTSETAQKILVTDVGGGYYSFTYTHDDGKKYAINNSSNDKAGNSALRGFGCWTYGGLDNEKFKLYSPSALDNSATVDLSGSWIITNSSVKVSLTSEASQANHLDGMTYSLNNGVTITQGNATAFTFTHVIRDWYTVRTDAGYLNITGTGVRISSTPQHLMVKTDDNYETIMLTTGEYLNSNDKVCPTYALNCASNKIFGNIISKYSANTRMQLVPATEFANGETVAFLSFDKNGGTAAEVPQTIKGEAGEKVVLPDMSGTKNSQEFIGWADVNNILSTVPGTNHTYHEVYLPGTSYAMKAGDTKLYAVYNSTNRNVQFGIRQDGRIVDEPNDNNVSDYIGHFTVNNILKEGHWVIDLNPTKPVNGYYIENNVTAALNWVPSAEEIAAALKKDNAKEGKVTFDPETQYIHYYVLKYAGKWKIDGVIRNKANVEIAYEVNAPAGVDKTKVSNMPGSYQVAPGADILIGADQDSTEIKRPALNGYYFMGWNTEKDGSGEYFDESSTVHLTNNLHLYAQWKSEADNPLQIRISSNWPKNKVGYVGARITLTASLTGFDGRLYTLQWQYSTDLENWVDVPNAHGITYTYTLDETTTHYTWRVVAQDIH